MKKLLALIASPRKLGNSELFAKEIARHLAPEWDLYLVRLPSLDIKPCKACYTCLFEDQECVQKDDMEYVVKALLEADGYLIVAPTYFLGPNSSLKRILDRGLCLYSHIDNLWGKPSVAVAIAGIEGLEGYTKLGVESFAKLIYSDLKASTVIYGALPGESLLNDQNKKRAKSLAEAFLGEREIVQVPLCPICGGDTFRFLSSAKVRCMLCSNEGTLSTEDGKILIGRSGSHHNLFTSLEGAKAHAEWLRGMKRLFVKKRKELKSICLSYAREGMWLEPKK